VDRVIETLEDAENCYASGKATPLEWERCYSIFVKVNNLEKATDCLVLGIEAIRRPADKTNLAQLIGDWISLQIDNEGRSEQKGPWLQKFADRLRREQGNALVLRHDKFASYLDSEIREASEMAEALILAKDGSKYALLRLAKKLRKPKKYDKFIRWNRPSLALEILNELLVENEKNSYARNCRAAVHLDLGNITDSLSDSLQSIRQNPRDKAALLVNASAHLEIGSGTSAWEPLTRAWAIEKSTFTLAMMLMAIGMIAHSNQFVPEGHPSLKSWREWISVELANLVGEVDSKQFQKVAQIACIRNFCSSGRYLNAYQYLAELER
jgi:tetratricopeptide (TPR) repeat protein